MPGKATRRKSRAASAISSNTSSPTNRKCSSSSWGWPSAASCRLVLSVTQLTVTFIQNWVTLHVNTRISISLVSDFLSKLMKLPLAFFDSKNVGDIMQRIGDNGRIRSFLTGSTLTTLFSFGNFVIFAFVMAFYTPNKGKVKIGNVPVEDINPHLWRRQLGAVMQEGFIYSDTIANNIAVGDEAVDKEKLHHAVEVANIREFIESLPLKYNTKIGMEGNGVSQGQRQRLLIARAVYKDPEFFFLDEATNALDARNERAILENLDTVYKGKTVVIVAHRLSTVQHADKIIVLDKGKVAEEGTHGELTARRGAYYRLVKNQLELGS